MIYIVEDDDAIRELEQYALQSNGYEVASFASSEPFWQAMRTEAPELVILDVMLPGEDGFSILKKLRNTPSPHRERCGAAPDRKRDRGVSSADGHTGQTNLLAARKACSHPAVHRLSCSPEADGHPASGLPDGLRHAAAGCGTVSTVGRALPWGGTFLLAAGERPAASAGAQSAVHRLSRRV